MSLDLILSSLGWALLHSIWQGFFAAGIVYALRASFGSSSASLRYGFQFMSLLACFAVFIATFSLYAASGLSGVSAPTVTTSFTEITQLGKLTLTPTGEAVLTIHYTQILQKSSPLIGAVWALGFVIVSLRCGISFQMTQALRKSGLSPAPQHWDNRFRTLTLNAGLPRMAKIFISDKVSGPLTLGFFKPIVLVPASFFTQLPKDQIEAVLLHEIAHIRRHDYLLNILQTAIKAVFFYHPGIHYISRLINEDREYACDDYSVSETSNPKALAKALATLRLQHPQNSFALAASGKSSPLLARLQRLMKPAPLRRERGQASVPALALLLSSAIYLSVAPMSEAHPVPKAPEPPQHIKSAPENAFTDRNKNGEHTHRPPAVPVMPVAPVPPAPPIIFDFGSMGSESLKEALREFENKMEQFEIEMEAFGEAMEIWGQDFEHSFQEKYAKAFAGKASDNVMNTYEDAIEAVGRDLEGTHSHRRAEHESAYERASEKRAQMTERAQDRGEARRERALERVERLRERAEARAERMRERSSERSMRTSKRSDTLRETLYGYLLDDKLIGSRNERVVIKRRNDQWVVNGAPISEQDEDKYCQLFLKSGINKDTLTHIEISPGSTHIINQSHHDHKSRSKTEHKHKDGTWHDTSAKTFKSNITFTEPIKSPKVHMRFNKKGPTSAHRGIDFGSRKGAPVYASAFGIIDDVSTTESWGQRIRIQHKDGYLTTYANLDSFAVSHGETVKAGDVIGTVGNSADVTVKPHLHFEIQKDGKLINPEYVITSF